MARIEWVKHRLENWAAWKDRESSGSLGFSSQSSFLSEANSGYRETIVPINDVDASVTNEAIESLKPARSHLRDCLYAIYVDDMGIRGAALHLGKAESTIKAQLDAADHAISAWLSDRASRRNLSTS